MALSDSPEVQARNSVRRRGTSEAASGKYWSDSQKVETVTLWLSMGNLRLVAATLGIPEITVRKWRATQWWKEVAEEIQLQDRIQLSASAKNIINKSLEVVTDRLQNGDWIYDQKTGQMKRKPVSMKDALSAASTMMDQKQTLDRVDVSNNSNESVDQRLERLMEKFAAMAAPKPAQVTDIVYVQEEQQDDRTGSQGSIEEQVGMESPDEPVDRGNGSIESMG